MALLLAIKPFDLQSQRMKCVVLLWCLQGKKLEEADCAEKDLVKMLFED